MTNPNDPAFSDDFVPMATIDPKEKGIRCAGLTKREYFAALAMNGISVWDAEVNKPIHAGKIEELARACAAYADALISELNKEPKP